MVTPEGETTPRPAPMEARGKQIRPVDDHPKAAAVDQVNFIVNRIITQRVRVDETPGLIVKAHLANDF